MVVIAGRFRRNTHNSNIGSIFLSSNEPKLVRLAAEGRPRQKINPSESPRDAGWLTPGLYARGPDEAAGLPTTTIFTGNHMNSLSPRRKQLATLVSEGQQNKEIAYTLGLTEGTVKVYLSDLFAALGVPNRAALAAWAVRNPDALAKAEY